MPVTRNPNRGTQLGYAEITSNATFDATEDDIAGLSVTVTVGQRPIVVEFGCRAISNPTANAGCVIFLKESTTYLWTWDDYLIAVAANFRSGGIARSGTLSPAAGSHTYKISAVTGAASTGTIVAEATAPAYIRVLEV